ncbi:sensor histidine kinase [Bacillus chungangensis]|uniref:DNA-binding response OmpR family regulator n=1 Tax=Bacillus chungangensis TaxID=587633 RepID=A0ABT9WV96_9BACI|nr:histidine kinase [Bacillus chungangensis]MDQ0177034.1 DNA-binding response OmpR family regulator [Bacillus chungangensis]
MHRRLLLSAIILVIFTVQICIVLLNIMPLHYYPKAKQGILNLSEKYLALNRDIPLRGEWIYYPDQQTSHDDNQKKMFVKIPSTIQLFSNQKTKKNNGTYHLKMILPNIEEAEVFAFNFFPAFNAHTIYLKNKKIDEHGVKGKKDDVQLNSNTLKWMYFPDSTAKQSLSHVIVKKHLKYLSFTGLIYLVNMIFFLFGFIFLCADFPFMLKALLFWLPFIFIMEILLLWILWKTTIKHPKENAPLIIFIIVTCYIGASITNLFYMINVLEINNVWIVQLLVLIVAIIAIMMERFFALFRHLVTANKNLLNENNAIQFSLPLAHQFTYEPIAPSASEVAASKTPSKPINSDLPQKQENTILIVEEDEAFREKLVRLLTAQFTKVIAVSDGKEILSPLTKGKEWDFILLDIHLLSENSLTICKKLREVYTMFELPIMMMSSEQIPEQTSAAFAAGANDMILKSIDLNELKSRIQMLLYLKKSVEDKICMEITFLQAQVRPHFLFNTLNAVAALSEEDNDKMKELLIHFGYYLQESFSFNNIKPLSSLEREIKLVDAYLNIEKVRFQDRLEYELMIPDNLSLAIPPLTIQPLVENAVHHGILKKRKGGKILICVIDKQDELHVSVEDNGVGMSEKTIADILNHNNKNGVGVKNIHHRLKQMFGQGLFINSQELTGTKIFFSVPREEILDDCFDC